MLDAWDEINGSWMNAVRHYPNAPITEAVLDIKTELPGGVTIDTLAEVYAAERDRYPTRRSQVLFQGEISTGAQISTTARQTPNGYAFVSADGRQVFQARLDGFTFSRLTPYESWEPFRDEARRLWTIYRMGVQPTAIRRLAVRYVNRLDLPLPLADFKDYLRTVPEVSPDMEQGLSGFFMQLQLPLDDLRSMLQITQALVPPSQPESVSVLLDIDIFRESDAPSDERNLWAFFEKLRERKNRVFNACITERTRELIS